MSVDMVRKMLGAHYIDIPEMRRLLNRSESATYAYQQTTELKWGQAVNLFQNAAHDGVRELMLADLLPGSGYLVIKQPDTFDFNGDGDVDDRDVLAKTSESIGHGSEAIGILAGQEDIADIDAWGDALQRQLSKLIAAATAASAAVDHIQRTAPRRRSCRPEIVGLGRGVARG
ncbi:MAG: hypothetical protein AAGA29_05805 [Planctomycetota bacterium]